MTALLDPRRHQAARGAAAPLAASATEGTPPAARTLPFGGGTIRATANVAVFVHPAASLDQLAYARAVIDAEMEARG